ncbi:hypothetical protein FO519_001028 [Halicephalobus sp. NKZ332]|nr:hypothetical protein FO519_001028 [Halicephalobus sp. NKZ332]
MEDDGEAFEIDDRDLEYALDPTKRFQRRQTKDQQIYGIWADNDEEDQRPGFSLGSSAKLSKGVSFVSGGLANEPKDEEHEARPQKRPRMDQPSFSGGLHQGFAGLRSSGPDWAQNSGKNSVIMGMMKKMGYVEGKGLGAKKHGILEPIIPSVRQGRGAVGAYGKEASAVGPKFGETAAQAQAREQGGTTREPASEYVPRKGGWKKEKKNTIQYKTLDEVLAEDDITVIGTSASMKIIDMTGPQQKVYNDFQSFSRKSKAAAFDGQERRKFDIPELTQNINMLLDLTEEEIKRNDRQIKLLKDQNKSLDADCQQIRKTIIDEDEEMKRLQEVLDVVKEFSNSQNQTLSACKKLLLRLRREYEMEYKMYGLDAIALTNAMPMLREYFNDWNPLKLGYADHGMNLIKEWREVLQGESREMKRSFDRHKNELDALPAFDRCLWEAWMPAIRQAALKWDVKMDSDRMLDVVLTWMPILPDWIVDNLLEQVIAPRIKEQVDAWSPTVDEIPIHSWLLPWHSVLGHRLTAVYPIIRMKLAKSLKEWIATDSSAIGVVRPWKDVFAKSSMSSFLSNNIIPKLEQALLHMNLNPLENFEYPEFFAVINWTEIIGTDLTCQMMMRCFFPRWLDNLCLWLNTPGVILSDVARYYKEWRERFPANLAAIPSIKMEFQRALNLISQAKQNLPIQLTPVAPASQQPPLQFFAPPSARTAAIGSLRELIEMRAQAMGVVFMPVRNRLEHGKQVYQLGNIQILFDRDLLIAYNSNVRQWEPVTVDYALELAVNS